MTEENRKHALVKVADRPEEQRLAHPLNPQSEMHAVSLGDTAGMERMGVHFVRIPPGKESNVYHRHFCEEEWWFILSGHGVAEIDGEEHAVGPGDFMGFSTPSVGHFLKNDSDEDVVYLVGGERKETEICEFPHLEKLVFRVGRRAEMVGREHLQRLRPAKQGS